MGDNEIVKALECCANLEACQKCPMANMQKYDTDICEHQIMFYSLDLINRQKEEIAEQKSDIENLKDSNINLQELYYAEKEKVAKSKQKVIDVCRQLQTAKAEIERLNKFALIRNLSRYETEIKVEAYKEFAEKVKMEAENATCVYEPDRPQADNMVYHISNIRLNKILKELVGDDDG